MPVANNISDAMALAIFQSSMHSIAEEMGAALRRTSISPNIKERRDYSCAVFDAQRRVIAMGDHMPVHLGSMPMSVKAAVEALRLERGDVVILNDPYAGGTHLPDITLVVPVFVDELRQSRCFMWLRARIMRMSGERLPAPWARGGRYFKKAFAFLQSALCAGARSIRKFFLSSCITYARRWSAKGIWWRRSGRARWANADCWRSCRSMDWK